MQDILTFLGRAESEPGLGAGMLRGNAEGRWFVARPNRSAAFSFSWPWYVGAVLTASFSPTAPIQSIENALKAGPGASASSQDEDLLSSAPTLRRDCFKPYSSLGSAKNGSGGKKKVFARNEFH